MHLVNIIKAIFILTLTHGLALAAPPIPVPAPPALAAKSYILLDPNSGYVLAEKAPDARLEPASITKLMTAYVLFNELANGAVKLEDEVSISEKAWRAPGSRMFIEVGTRVKVEDLLRGMIIQSGNDASIALAENTAGSESSFATLMNHHAKRLGMTGSNFVNSTGLPHKDHYTTARDIAKIARALLTEFPAYYPWYSEKQFSYNNITQYNRNKLLWRDKSVDGMKTGHTDSAGYCLVASALRDKMRLISVVLGTKSEEARAKQSQTLLNFGFRFFETHNLYSAGEPLSTARIWKGDKESLPLGLSDDLYVTIPRGRYKSLSANMLLAENILAPANKGHEYGTLSIRMGDKPVVEKPLIALEEVETGSFVSRMLDEVKMWFR